MTTHTDNTQDVLRDIDQLHQSQTPARVAFVEAERRSVDEPDEVTVAQEARVDHARPLPEALPPMGPVSPGLQEMARRLESEASTLIQAIQTFQDHARQFRMAVQQEQQRPQTPYPVAGYPPQGYGAPQAYAQPGGPYRGQPQPHPQPGYPAQPQYAPPPPNTGHATNPFSPEGRAAYPQGYGQQPTPTSPAPWSPGHAHHVPPKR